MVVSASASVGVPWGMTATTLNGDPLTFELTADGAFVNGVEIVVTDIPACNGVIHVVDAVIVPSCEDGVQNQGETSVDCGVDACGLESLLDTAADDPLREPVGILVAQHPRPGHARAHDRRPPSGGVGQQVAAEVTGDRLDLGKLRHRRRR